MTTIYSDAAFKRIANADRRVNQGLAPLDLTANYEIQAHEHDFLRVVNSSVAALLMTLPDATTLPLGYDVKVQLVSGPNVDILLNGTSAPAGVIKAVVAGKTYGFRLMGNSSAAGEWLIYSLGIEAPNVEAYVRDFEATDWTDETTDWALSTSAATHGLGDQPVVAIFESTSSYGSTYPWLLNGVVRTIEAVGNVVYVGGDFTTANGVTVNRFAKWENGAFTAIGIGCNGPVHVIKSSGAALYIGGAFTTAGGLTVNRIAKFEAGSYSPFGNGCNGLVRAIRVDGTNVYVGGDFTTCNSIPTNYIATWDEATGVWHPFTDVAATSESLTSGANDVINSIAYLGGFLYVGGAFSNLLGQPAERVAKIDLQTLEVSALGTGLDATVNAIAVDSVNNRVYIGGDFTSVVGGITVNRITYWNVATSAFVAMGSGRTGPVLALAVDAGNNRVYVGGNFSMGVVYWNGSSFVSMDVGVNGIVYAIAVNSINEVYVGGSFTAANGVTVNRITRWNGSAFVAMGTGCNNSVTAIAVDAGNSRVYVGGLFTTANSVTVNRTAYWNGTTFVAMGSGCDGAVYALAVDTVNSRVYVGGEFATANGVTVNRITYWNGTTFIPVGTGFTGALMAFATDSSGNLYAAGTHRVSRTVVKLVEGQILPMRKSATGTENATTVLALAIDSNFLYVGGTFLYLMGQLVNRIARIDLDTLECVPFGSGCNAAIYTIAVDAANNRVYIGGNFTLANGVTVSRIAYWNGTTFVAMGTGCNGTVTEITVDAANNRVYIGGDFTLANGVTANRIAYWNGTTFVAMGTGCNSNVAVIAVDAANNRVYIGGNFTLANGVTVNRVAYWNGTTFVAMGTGCNSNVSAIAVDASNNRVYIGGNFTQANSVAHNRIAYWNGSNFVAMGTGCSNSVTGIALDTANNRLYVAGYFGTANGVIVNNIAYWNGTTFVAMGAGCNNGVMGIALDAANSRVFSGGEFATFDSVVVNRVAAWDTISQSVVPLGQGFYGSSAAIKALARDAQYLYVGGEFSTLLGTPCTGLARISLSTFEVTSLPLVPGSAIEAIAVDATNNRVYVGGSFYLSDYSSPNVAYWNGTTFVAMGAGCDNTVYALAVDAPNGRVFVGGDFTTADIVAAERIAYWDLTTSAFVAMGSGCDGRVNTIAIHPTSGYVYLGGEFIAAGGVDCYHFSRWQDGVFEYIGQFDYNVMAIAIDSVANRVYVGGEFATFEGEPITKLMYWAGGVGTSLGSGPNGAVYAIAILGGNRVCFGGDFTTVNGSPILKVATYVDGVFVDLGGCSDTGSVRAVNYASGGKLFIGGNFQTTSDEVSSNLAWAEDPEVSKGATGLLFGTYASETGANGPVHAIETAATKTFFGGEFTSIGFLSCSRVAYLEGGAFSAMGAGRDGTVRALYHNQVDTLYIGGDFTGCVSKWNGTTFTAVGSGANAAVYALAGHNSGVLLGGDFTSIDGVAASRVAMLSGTVTPVPEGSTDTVLALQSTGTDTFFAGGEGSFREHAAPLNPYIFEFGSEVPITTLQPTGADMRMDASGNIDIRAEKLPEMRFSGRLIVRI